MFSLTFLGPTLSQVFMDVSILSSTIVSLICRLSNLLSPHSLPSPKLWSSFSILLQKIYSCNGNLYWLLIKSRTHFKILLITNKTLNSPSLKCASNSTTISESKWLLCLVSSLSFQIFVHRRKSFFIYRYF